MVQPMPMKLANTPVEQITVNGHGFYLKRDDLLHRDFSGNKARKFYALLQRDLSATSKLIGYGSAQANSLHSLAVLARLKSVPLDFYVDHIPSFLRQNPAGNYRSALDNGTQVIAVDKAARQQLPMADYLRTRVLPDAPEALFIPEGGSDQAAGTGIGLLAEEIIGWAGELGLTDLKVALPSGTGTTALFLQKHFCQRALPFEVLTCACVGDEAYLRLQFTALSADQAFHPRILPTHKKYHFGRPVRAFYHVWQQLQQQTGVTFELLYDPLGWITLLDYVQGLGAGAVPILYIHQGGLLGNETMLPRYRRKWPDCGIN